jgi:superfamily II DNA or RNA helicase
LHLLDQWEESAKKFGFYPLKCSSAQPRWQITLNSLIQDFNLGLETNISVLVVHKTAASKKFNSIINQLKGNNLLIIGDEAHGLGAKNTRNALNPTAKMRLGLSATPRRWFDEEGTKAIFEYFGDVCFEYTLEKAIGRFLTEYEYYPELVNLTDQEKEEYQDLTMAIIKLMNRNKGQILSNEIDTKVKKLLLKRSRIISAAENKLTKLVSKLKELKQKDIQEGTETNGILIYCAPGKHKEVLKAVSKIGYRCHEFVHDVNLIDRERVLEQFSDGVIQVLVAIKCLDEGVDVPSTKMAFILASSTNPREFVQRRGRILRKHENKQYAIIYDYIVVPTYSRTQVQDSVETSILKREMPRFVEFASSATNQYVARRRIRPLLDQYEMLHLLDEKPWEVYHNLKGWDWRIENED